jgi:hypothetical protein
MARSGHVEGRLGLSADAVAGPLRALAVGAVVLLGGCGGGSESITIKLDELNDSGISGAVRLEPTENRTTRFTVVEVEGGTITGARVTAGPCGDGRIDDNHSITPPEGIIQLDFRGFREWDRDHPLAAAFMRNGRYVACGET